MADNSSKNNSSKQGTAAKPKPQQQQRTIQVKVGNQAAQTLTPDQAADYLKNIAQQTSWITNSLGGASGSIKVNKTVSNGQRQVHMTIAGPAATSSSAAASSTSRGQGSNSKSAASSASSSSSRPPSFREPGMPCSEKEMKALMSMFVEIMGLQMNTDRLNQMSSTTSTASTSTTSPTSSSTSPPNPCGLPAAGRTVHYNSKRRAKHAGLMPATTSGAGASVDSDKLFHFPSDVPPPPGGWPEDLMWPSSSHHDLSSANGPSSSNTNNDDDDESLDELYCMPALEDIPPGDRQNTADAAAATARLLDGAADPKQDPLSSQPPLQVATRVAGIVPFEWEALERVAVEEALEHEERTRKINKKQREARETSKQNLKKEALVNEAALVKAEELYQLRKKAILAWRNRVVATFHRECQQGTTAPTPPQDGSSSLQELLDNSPLFKEYEKLESLQPHLQVFLPLLLPKSRYSLDKGRMARARLAAHVITLHVQMLCQPTLRNGQSVLHSACWLGDTDLVTCICRNWQALKQKLSQAATTAKTPARSNKSDNKKKDTTKTTTTNSKTGPQATALIVPSLDITCHESGWTPLQYAAVAGCLPIVEVLLQHGCQVDALTSDTHTWSKQTGSKGVTALELVRAILSNKVSAHVESHGMALQTVQTELLKQPSTVRYRLFLEHIAKRLEQVERHGYTARTREQVNATVLELERCAKKQEEAASMAEDAKSKRSDTSSTTAASTCTSKRNRSKNKNKMAKHEDEMSIDNNTAAAATVARANAASSRTVEPTKQQQEDPLVVALSGMGFTHEQIQSGIKSCGGLDRATADEVVVWILGQTDEATSTDAQEQQVEVESMKQQAAAASSSAPDEETKLAPDAGAQGWNDVEAKKDMVAKKRDKASRRQEEERLAAAERQQLAKSEEQRRRITRLRTRPLASNADTEALPVEPTKVPTAFAAKPQPRKVAPQPITNTAARPTWMADPSDVWHSVEASTVASSIEHGTIEIINDDATISTLGSFQARATPVGSLHLPTLQPTFAPPGFAPPAMPSEASFREQSPWEVSQNLNYFGAPSQSFNHVPESNFGPPPGIREATPMVSHMHAPLPPVAPSPLSSHPFARAPPQSLHAPPLRVQQQYNHYDGGIPSGYPAGGPNLVGGAAVGPNLVGVGGTNLAQYSSSNAGPTLGGLFPNHGPLVDSSVIDSISTRLGNASLWGDPFSAVAAPGSSRLIGNVIPTAGSTAASSSHDLSVESAAVNAMFGVGGSYHDRRKESDTWGQHSGSIW